jgi:arsenate reductase
MAAALLRRRAGDAIVVRSAGTAPADEIVPTVRDAMAEVGIDLGDAGPKVLDTAAVEAADVVITMGCGDACPVLPGRRYLDWDLPDPAGRAIEDVRAIRDDIDRRVASLVAELTG